MGASAEMCHVLAVNFNHDGTGVVLSDGAVRGYVTTERFSRRKKHPGLRREDLDELLDQASIGLGDVDQVILCNLANMDSPDIVSLHGSDLKDTWFDFSIDEAAAHVSIDGHEIPCIVNPDHHRLHAANAFFTSPFDSAMVLAADPTGSHAYIGRGRRLLSVGSVGDGHRAHIGYVAVAHALFGSSLTGAGKVMGLAPYGRPEHEPDIDPRQVTTFEELRALASHAPIMYREGDRELNATLAHLVQWGLERQMIDIVAELAEIASVHGVAPNVCMSGGTALNALANERALRASRFARLYLHPACGDDGTALGAALSHWHERLDGARREFSEAEIMYSVRRYDDAVEPALADLDGAVDVERRPDWIARAAELVASGAVVGWFQGASEVGPRALGNRSILADPRHSDMREKVNRKVKFREGFRPFAPSVLAGYADEWFGMTESPFMLRMAHVRKPSIPAVTHVDGTARIQTVAAAANPSYYELIDEFRRRTGVPLVLNTSFNIKGEPIVETPSDAVESFLRCGMDALVFPGWVVLKRRPED
jgi:carbamoyltransferase